MNEHRITTIQASDLEEGTAPSFSSCEDADDDSLATPRGSLTSLHSKDGSPRLSTYVEDITRVNTPVFNSSANTSQTLEKISESSPKKFSSEDSEKGGPPPLQSSENEDNEKNLPIPKLELEGQESALNWSKTKKWSHTVLAAAIFFNASFGSSSANSASQIYQQQFGVSHVEATLILSIFVLGYVFGPVIWAAMSESKGRKMVNVVSLFLLACFHMACALVPNFAGLVVLRFIAGFCAAAPLSNSGSFISDMWSPIERLWPMMCYTVTALLSPALGPIAGGFLSDAYLWREIYWLNCAMSGTLFFTSLLFQKETYAPVLLEKKVQRMQNKSMKEKFSLPRIEMKIVKEAVRIHMLRPLRLLTTEAPVIYAAGWSSFCYSILFIFFEVYPLVFGEIYGFNGGEIGLAFIGLIAGIFSSIPVVSYYNKAYIRKRKAAGKPVPEERLKMTIWSALCYVVGFLWFGWTSRASIHWIVPIIGTVPIGSGLIFGFNSLATYTVELYIKYAASALAALAISRSIFAFAFPLFSTQMFEKLGIGWGCSVLALISLVASPIPFVFNRYGIQIRNNSKMAVKDQ